MANGVFANTREIACKAAKGKTMAAFPDVCFTPPDKVPPTPPGVPIPYPNTGMASDTTKGSKKVLISNKEIVLKNKSYFKKSTGDEAGCAAKKGVITSKTKGKVYFQAWSMDVKIEGMNATRHLDMTTNNHASMPGDTPPWPYIDSMAVDLTQPKDKEKKGNIKVKVIDNYTGEAVTAVEVRVNKIKKKTNDSGEAEFTNLQEKSYKIKVYYHNSECDYVTFVIHYPRVLLPHKAEAIGLSNAIVIDKETTNVVVKIKTFRLVPEMFFHRKHLDLNPNAEDKYGHWWTRINNTTSVGWWPKYRFGEDNWSGPPPTPPEALKEGASILDKVQFLFSSIVYAAKRKSFDFKESAPLQTFKGVEGDLNSEEFGGTSANRGDSTTQDPHHLDVGDEQYQPVIYGNSNRESLIRSSALNYALSYSGKWSWFLEAGNHCHTLQKKIITHCELGDFKKLE